MPSKTEKELLQICKEVLFTINETVGVLPNNRLPAGEKGTDAAIYEKLGGDRQAYIDYLQKYIDPLIGKQRELLEELIEEHSLKQDEIVEQMAAVTQRTKVGNCEQMACLAFVYLQAIIPETRIELVTTDQHMFVVINRKKDSDIAKPSEYGPEAIICDPWARRSYNARLFNVEKALYRPAAPEDLYNEGSYLKGTPSLFHSYEPEPAPELDDAKSSAPKA